MNGAIRKVGRPLKIQSKEELTNKINEYFSNIDEERITISGLCLYLGINKDTFYEYAKKNEYKEIIDQARLIVENSYEISLRENGRTADIFALKNFGWSDKVEVKNTNLPKVEELLSKIEEQANDN